MIIQLEDTVKEGAVSPLLSGACDTGKLEVTPFSDSTSKEKTNAISRQHVSWSFFEESLTSISPTVS